MISGDAYGLMSEPPPAFAKATHVQVDFGSLGRPSRIVEAFEECYEDLCDILCRRTGAIACCNYTPAPPPLALSRYPLWYRTSWVADAWVDLGIFVRAEPYKLSVSLVCFSLALDSLLVASHSVPPHSLEISHEFLGSFTLSGGEGGSDDPARLGCSVAALLLGGLVTAFSSSRSVRKITNPAGHTQSEKEESDRIEERTAKVLGRLGIKLLIHYRHCPE